MCDVRDLAVGLAVGLIVLVAGGAIAGGGLYLQQDARQASVNAVEVEGTVLSSTVGEKAAGGDTQTGVHYFVEIEYRYRYDGQTFTSHNLCPGRGSSCDLAQSTGNRTVILDRLTQYPEGDPVTVYVPQDEPEEAYLVDASEASTNDYGILVGVGGLLGVVGLLLAVGAVWKYVSG